MNTYTLVRTGPDRGIHNGTAAGVTLWFPDWLSYDTLFQYLLDDAEAVLDENQRAALYSQWFQTLLKYGGE